MEETQWKNDYSAQSEKLKETEFKRNLVVLKGADSSGQDTECCFWAQRDERGEMVVKEAEGQACLCCDVRGCGSKAKFKRGSKSRH